MRVLVACEFSGVVRDAFAREGHYAQSCDLLPSERPGLHHQGDVRDLLDAGWDLMIAHPPCTCLSRAGARWRNKPGRAECEQEGLAFVLELYNAPIPKVAIENPIGRLNQLWRYPDQTIQPYHFGHPFSKATCLWLKNLPPLMHTQIVEHHQPLLPSNIGKGRREGQKWHKGVTRDPKVAATTFEGVAAAMAHQWGGRISLI